MGHKTWYEIRWLLVIALLVPIPMIWRILPPAGAASSAPMDRELVAALTGAPVSEIARYLQARLLSSDLMMWLLALAILAGAGGLGADRGRGVSGFVGGLPLSRRRIVFTRFGGGALVMLTGGFAAAMTMALLTAMRGNALPLAVAWKLGLCLSMAGVFAMALTFMLTNLMGRLLPGLAAATALLATLYLIPIRALAPLRFAITDLMMAERVVAAGTLPWQALGVATLLAAAAAWVTAAAVERMDL